MVEGPPFLSVSEASTRRLTLTKPTGAAPICERGYDGGDGGYGDDNAGSTDSGGADSGHDSGGAGAGLTVAY